MGWRNFYPAATHATIAVYGALGLTPWRTNSLTEAEGFGLAVACGLLIFGAGGLWAVLAGRTMYEVIALRVEAALVCLLGLLSLTLLQGTGFTQWMGVCAVFALSASLATRSKTLTIGLDAMRRQG